MIRSAYGYSTLTDLIFGKLTVLSDGYVKNKNRIVPVRCECGVEKEVYFQNLVRELTISCGCVAAKQASERLIQNPISRNLPDGEAAKNALLSLYKNQARKRGLNWELTKEAFLSLTKENCFYCGTTPGAIKKTQYKTGEYIYNGIDRINNDEGYTASNVVACCKICNIAKNEMTLDEFKNWILKVYNNLGE